MQLIDAAVLDVQSLQYHPRALIAAALYVLLTWRYGQASKEAIAGEFTAGSRFLNERYPFNDLFGDFLAQTFGYQLAELLPTIQYIAVFIVLPFNYALPGAHGHTENVKWLCKV